MSTKIAYIEFLPWHCCYYYHLFSCALSFSSSFVDIFSFISFPFGGDLLLIILLDIFRVGVCVVRALLLSSFFPCLPRLIRCCFYCTLFSSDASTLQSVLGRMSTRSKYGTFSVCRCSTTNDRGNNVGIWRWENFSRRKKIEWIFSTQFTSARFGETASANMQRKIGFSPEN